MMETSEATGVHIRGTGGGDQVIRILGPGGVADPGADPRLDADLLRTLYAAMSRTRLVDRGLAALCAEGRIAFHVSSVGEEASAVVAAAALREQDWFVPGSRALGALLWRGVPLRRLVDAAFACRTDAAKGRRMLARVSSRAHRVAPSSPLRGTQITQGVGVAWAAKIAGDPVVVAVSFEGSEVASADFHTGLNFAGVLRVPAVFLCRTELAGAPSFLGAATGALADRCVAYGLQALRCDGTDALAVWVAVNEAVEQAAAGRGAILVELLAPGGGRSGAAGADPVLRLRDHLGVIGAWTDSEQAALEERVEAELAQCVAEASKAGPPSVESLHEDVYSELPWHLREQQQALLAAPPAQRAGPSGGRPS